MQAQSIPFRKMNGLGNDFVVLDARRRALPLAPTRSAPSPTARRASAAIRSSRSSRPRNADVFMRIWNADGGEVGACGNAARCVAALVAAERGRAGVSIETESAMLAASVNS